MNIFVFLLVAQVSKVGVASSTFLSLNYDPVSAAMGGAYTAVAESPLSGLTNPAGISNLKSKYTFCVSSMRWMDIGEFPIVGAVINMRNRGNLGIYLAGSYLGNMPETKVTENGIVYTGKDLSYKTFMMNVTYAKYYTDKFSAGFSIKLFHEDYGGYVGTNNVAIDIGSFYWTGFKSLRIGLVIKNLGPDSKPRGSYNFYTIGQGGSIESHKEQFKGYPLPMSFEMGAAMEVIENLNYKLTLSLEAIHPNDYYEGLSVGADFKLLHLFNLRGGYMYNQGEQKFAAGFGINIRGGLGLDYSYTYMNTLPPKHRIQIYYNM